MKEKIKNVGKEKIGLKYVKCKRSFFAYFICNLFIAIGFGMIFQLLSLFVYLKFSVDIFSLSFFWMAIQLSMMIPNYVAGKISSKVGRKNPYVLVMFIFCISIYSLLIVDTLIVAVLVISIIYCTSYIGKIFIVSYLFDIILETGRGRIYGFVGTVHRIAHTLAPSLGAWIVEKYNFAVLFLFSAIICMGGVIFFSLLAVSVKQILDSQKSIPNNTKFIPVV